MKNIKFLFYVISFSFLVGCGSDDSASSESDIIADFSFENDGSLFSFTNLSQGATTYRWDFGDLSFYCEKENPKYRYVTVGGEIEVTLTAINQEGQEAYVTKTIVAPEVLDVEIAIDGSFEDWSDIDYLYEELDGVSVQKIKVWGKGDNINVYLEGNTNMKMELVDIFINSDGDSASGFLSWQWPNGSGADYLFEGPLLSNSWGAFYEHTDPNGGWAWNWLGQSQNMISSGIISLNAQNNAVEFSIPKTQLGSLGSTIGFAFTEMTSGWAGVGSFPKVTATSSFVVYEIPIEEISLCE
ncbi:PKD domain-containing protein [Aestuariibaculum marinum]|uniref:PKD domain-containing protein n=1 Tax=Aestuariibaculum marinum TaxID=2683592 RepID=A0A8J6Q8L0_9FLAO|nr:PKD domain-containing protein [Aestuariibaculum marinum]MBD0825378.1 PKD domain-containing protein [Aestuariibaculum marinum]